MKHAVLFGIRPSFPGLSQSAGQITHVLLTRSPLESLRRALSVRLACVKHAASVRPEPESNSPNKTPTPKRRAEFKSEKFDTKQDTKTGIQNHTPKRENEAWQKQQTKPPNTLLSSQTTDQHFATRSQATLPAYFRVLAVSTRWSNHFQILRQPDNQVRRSLYPLDLRTQTREVLDEQRIALIDMENVVHLSLPRLPREQREPGRHLREYQTTTPARSKVAGFPAPPRDDRRSARRRRDEPSLPRTETGLRRRSL